jgi:hypothetical protein
LERHSSAQPSACDAAAEGLDHARELLGAAR